MPLALSDFVAGVLDAPASDPQQTLQQIVDATNELFGLAGAGIMLRDEDEILRYVTASDDAAVELERVQEELGVGPCIDCVLFDRVTASDDLASDPRWPRISARVRERTRAILGIPIRLAGAPVGSLNVRHDQVHKWSDSDRNAMEAFAALAERTLADAVRSAQQSALVARLQHALDHRVSLERAIGYLMGKHQISEAAAFETLRASARSTGRSIDDIARDLPATGTLG